MVYLPAPLYIDQMALYPRSRVTTASVKWRAKAIGSTAGNLWNADMKKVFGDNFKLSQTSVDMQQDLMDAGRIGQGRLAARDRPLQRSRAGPPRIAQGYGRVGHRPHRGRVRKRKVAAKQEADIRPCVGMGYCIDSVYDGRGVCIHNPATGREATIPHVTRRSDGPRREIVIVGAGPGGLEAARVSAERGHDVTVFEAADQPGGQVRITAGLQRRREILGIVDWRVAQCEKKGVTFHLDTYAETQDVLAEAPDIMVVATGGVPDMSFLDAGEDLVTSGWDLLTGAVRVAETVLLSDGNGAQPGMTAAEFVADSGASLEVVTPERTLAPDVGGTNYPAYFRALNRSGARITINQRLESVQRDGNALDATLFDDYGKTRAERRVDQVVVGNGTTPVDELYFTLKPRSRNRGAIDYGALLKREPQPATYDGAFLLFRIGDAGSSRNIHAAVYDALRLGMDC